VNERPKLLASHPTDQDRAFVVNDLVMCLRTHNVASNFDARTPTKNEYEECDRIALTYPFPKWCPHDMRYAKEELKRKDDEGYARLFHLDSRISSVTHDEQDFLMEITRGEARITDQWNHHISSNINSISYEKFKLSQDPLRNNWCIGRTLAERTLQATTQLRVKTVANPPIERRWPTGDRPLRYR
jgi:hypothetical protein